MNQWKYRSLDGSISFLGEYFLNDGHLNGEETREQFFRVTSMCELVQFQVHGFCSDGGGSNARFIRLVTTDARTEDVWLPPGFYSFKHPFYSLLGYLIFIWLCAAHGLKALRNQAL